MTSGAYRDAPATARRLALALSASALGHAAVLANAALGPGLQEFALFAPGQPIRARLAPAPQDAESPELPARRPESGPVSRSRVAGAPEAASPAGLAAPEIYYRGSELDERALATNHPDIEYPEEAFASGTSGTVKLRLMIDHRGVLREASVMEALPAGVFEAAALKAARALRFRPAIRNGVPVGSIKLIEVPFDPDCMRTGSCVAEPGEAKNKP